MKTNINSNKENIIGYCKECGNEIEVQDKIDGYNIYECSLCKYPSHIIEIEK